jgi:hypothetical protein
MSDQLDMFPDEVTHVTLGTTDDTDPAVMRTMRAQTRLIDTLQQLAALQQMTIQRLESELAEAKCLLS